MAFHAGQLAFGGVLWVWTPLMLLTLGLLLRAEHLAEVRAEQGERSAAHADRTEARRPESRAAHPSGHAAPALPHRRGAGHVDRHS